MIVLPATTPRSTFRPMETLGKRLKTARESAGMTQPELADKAGMSQQMISKIERDESTSSPHVVKLARILGVRAEWLGEGVGPMTSEGHINRKMFREIFDLVEKVAEEKGKVLSKDAKIDLISDLVEYFTDHEYSEDTARHLLLFGLRHLPS